MLEAETGLGKTEAALWRFVHLFNQGAVDGLYFALPTRVAATQMFERIKKLRDALFPEEDRPAVVLAVPGQVGADDARGHSLPEFGFEWDDVPTDQQRAQQRAQRWAAEHPKRFLAAQIAVGTIDQVLPANIATRHAHLRGAALLRHLLVVDEVHASDRFMEVLLANLLQSHLQAGGHALLLSATFGAGAKARLLGTRQRSLAEAEGLAYPAYSWAVASDKALPIAQPTTGKTVQIGTEPWLNAPEDIAALARAAADAGAKVLVIRNTVGAAVATLQALESLGSHAALFQIGDVATLHHGRFSASNRLLLDAQVEKVLGKNSPRAARIVMGTQTLEASLDLDADLLITDLCPMDVLLQRIGRLHRHAGRKRPAKFEVARVVVLTPATRDLLGLLRGRNERHGFGQVYADARIIEATWRLQREALPNATVVLDWWHAAVHFEHALQATRGLGAAEAVRGLERAKWRLWHGPSRMPVQTRSALPLGTADTCPQHGRRRAPGTTTSANCWPTSSGTRKHWCLMPPGAAMANRSRPRSWRVPSTRSLPNA